MLRCEESKTRVTSPVAQVRSLAMSVPVLQERRSLNIQVSQEPQRSASSSVLTLLFSTSVFRHPHFNQSDFDYLWIPARDAGKRKKVIANAYEEDLMWLQAALLEKDERWGPPREEPRRSGFFDEAPFSEPLTDFAPEWLPDCVKHDVYE